MHLDREEAIDKIMINFGWDQMLKTMEVLDWKWVRGLEANVPSIYEIHRCALNLLNEAWDLACKNKTHASISTGGLKAVALWNKETNGVNSLELNFIVTSWCEYEEE